MFSLIIREAWEELQQKQTKESMRAKADVCKDLNKRYWRYDKENRRTSCGSAVLHIL